jgi:hypothetical protein
MADAGEPGKVYSNVSALTLWLKRWPKDGNVIIVVDEGRTILQSVSQWHNGAYGVMDSEVRI